MITSAKPAAPPASDPRIWPAFLIYTLAITVISCFHEVWRDEAVIINMLRDSSSLWDFYAKAQNYGHPRLWHTLVYFSHLFFPSYSVLKILNLIICSAAIFIFLKYSPFKFWQRILFALGIFPIYVYPAFSRNYGLCMLLIFILALLYKERWKHIVAFSLTLILLAHTHVHTLIIALPVLAVLSWECLSSPSRRNPLNISALAAVAAGILLAVIHIIPESNTNLTELSAITGPAVAKALATAVFFPGKIFDQVFGVHSALWSNIIIYAAAFYFWTHKRLLIIFALSIIGLTVFSILFYPSDTLRHQGSAFLVLIFTLWARQTDVQSDQPNFSTPSVFRQHLETHKTAYITILLLLQICMAYPAVRKDILKNYSSSKPLAAFLSQHPELKNAVFIPVPGYLLESAPYYTPGTSIFLPREGVFRSYVRFTKESLSVLTLDHLLSMGEKIHEDKNVPVIFVLGFPISENGPYVIRFLRNKSFSFSQASYQTFRAKTRMIAEFKNAISDENYDLYLLNKSLTP